MPPARTRRRFARNPSREVPHVDLILLQHAGTAMALTPVRQPALFASNRALGTRHLTASRVALGLAATRGTRLLGHDQHLVHAVAIHVQHLENVTLLHQRLTFLRNMAETL